ncbi:helix-turn-helix domain-containing protein [Parafrankia elaeagni]|uniref:helix-turn-helix domain-containing protein n=1 Tax=Parafrankia elaeagni TaxID=222534 RepID=UPI000365DF63|nr:helix-turn-helix transcriptional regulator [Parafrankia elaeagni]
MFSKRLREARKAKGYTQEQLAEKVKTKKSTISNYETNYSTPSNEMLLDLSEVLGVSSDYLLGRSDKPYFFKMDEENIIDPEKMKTEMDNIGWFIQYLAGFRDDEPVLEIFDFSEWEQLNKEDISLINDHFKMMITRAKERKEQG